MPLEAAAKEHQGGIKRTWMETGSTYRGWGNRERRHHLEAKKISIADPVDIRSRADFQNKKQ